MNTYTVEGETTNVEQSVNFQSQKNRMLEKEIGDLKNENESLKERLDKMERYMNYVLLTTSNGRVNEHIIKCQERSDIVKGYKTKIDNSFDKAIDELKNES